MPFEQRLKLTGNKAPCPVHTSKDGTPVSLWKGDGGIWLATCHSKCDTTWDAIAFVQAVDGVDFKEAVARLGGKPKSKLAASDVWGEIVSKRSSTHIEVEEIRHDHNKEPMTHELWEKWGREPTEADVARFAASRPDSVTPGFEIMKTRGCRVKDDYIGFPYSYGSKIYGVKLRHMDEKRFLWEHKPEGGDTGLFNADAVESAHFSGNGYSVVESELDALLLEEQGFHAVSVPNCNPKFSDEVVEILQRAHPVFLIGDQDKPGQMCMSELQKRLPLKETHRVYLDGVKDVGELAKQDGDFASRIAGLHKQAVRSTWATHNIPLVHTLTKDEPKWVVDRMFPRGGLSILCSKQGGNKSLIALLAAQAITGAVQSPDEDHSALAFNVSMDFAADQSKRIPFQGSTFLGRAVPRPFPVLYIDRENSESEVTRRRLRTGLMQRDNFHYWGDWNDWTDPIKATPDAPDDPRLLEFAAKQQGFIIFDSLQDFYGDISEIDNGEVVKLMNRFKRLARLGAGVLVLHHDAKYGTEGFRGGTGFVAVPDMAIGAAKSEAGDGVITLRAIRFRQCANWFLDLRIHYTPHEDKVNTWQVETVRDMTEAEVLAAEKAAEKAAEARKEAKASAAEAKANAREEERRAKAEAKDAKDKADWALILERIPDKSPRAIETETCIGRARVISLARSNGWAWDAEKSEWSTPWKQADNLGQTGMPTSSP